MTTLSVQEEHLAIHLAVCRDRRRGLACSTCRALGARGWGRCRRCGAADHLLDGLCEPCRTEEAAS